MLHLAFDTTAGCCAVNVSRDGITVVNKNQKMDFGQAEALFPMIRDALGDWEVNKLDLITVCCGPGSFTGVRSSLAAARAMALAAVKTEVTGVSAFEAYVEDLEPEELAELNAVIIETKRDDFYFQCFDRQKKKIGDPEALNYEDIIDRLRYKKVTLIGDGVERFLSRPSGLSLHVIRMEESISIEKLARCGEEKYRRRALDYPKPLYLRAPDVCLKQL